MVIKDKDGNVIELSEEQQKKFDENHKQYRELTFQVHQKEIDEEKMIVPMSVSSEEPYLRWFGYEILGHKDGEIRLDRFKDGASFRDTHYGDQIGAVMNPKVDKQQKKLRVDVRFSKNSARAKEIFADIKDDIRKNVSIRYMVHEMVLEKETDEYAYYRVTDWEPIHASIEPDPADNTVGPGRSNEENIPETVPLLFDEEQVTDELKNQIKQFNEANKNKLKILINKRSKPMGDNQNTQTTPTGKDGKETDPIQVAREARDSELARIRAINAVVKDWQPQMPSGVNLEKEAEGFLHDAEKSSNDFQLHVLKFFKQAKPTQAPTSVDFSKKELSDYSIRKIILYQLGKLPEKEVGLELEADKEIKSRPGVKGEAGGLIIPLEIQRRRRELNLSKVNNNRMRDMLMAQDRGLVVGTPASGGYLVQDQYIQYSFIEYLQNASIFMNPGMAEFLPGMTGNIPMNRELDNYQYYHVGEGEGLTESEITFGQETMSPKKAGALGKYSYEFLLQSSLAVEAYIERRLAIACALGADYDIAYGSGTDNEPKGIKNWTGIGGTTGAGFNRSKALSLEGQIYTANANTLGTMRWVSRGALRSTLKEVDTSSGGNGKWLVKDDNTMIGYDYSMVSNQIEEGDLFNGVFSQVLVPYWDNLEIKASEYDDTAFKAGDILVRALQALDVFLLNPGALNYTSSVTT